jgi:hypothetical protein
MVSACRCGAVESGNSLVVFNFSSVYLSCQSDLSRFPKTLSLALRYPLRKEESKVKVTSYRSCSGNLGANQEGGPYIERIPRTKQEALILGIPVGEKIRIYERISQGVSSDGGLNPEFLRFKEIVEENFGKDVWEWARKVHTDETPN